MFSTCQIPNWKLFNAFLSELKLLLKKVTDSKSSFSDRVGVWILIFLRNIRFAKQIWLFVHLYKRQFLHSACVSKMHYWDWKFSEISFCVETSNVSDSELNVFQRVKFESTFSNIPWILDWVFYKVPDFELNFLWGRNNLGKIIGLKSITFWFKFSKKMTTILSFCLHF